MPVSVAKCTISFHVMKLSLVPFLDVKDFRLISFQFVTKGLKVSRKRCLETLLLVGDTDFISRRWPFSFWIYCVNYMYYMSTYLHKIWLASKVMKEWVMKLLQAKHFGAWKVNLGSKKKVHISTCQCHQLYDDLGLKLKFDLVKKNASSYLSLIAFCVEWETVGNTVKLFHVATTLIIIWNWISCVWCHLYFE